MGKYVVKAIMSVGFEPNLYRDEYVDADTEADAESQVTYKLQHALFDDGPEAEPWFVCYRGFRPDSRRPVYNYVRKNEIVYFFVSRVERLES
jgi:hypothetical protein